MNIERNEHTQKTKQNKKKKKPAETSNFLGQTS